MNFTFLMHFALLQYFCASMYSFIFILSTSATESRTIAKLISTVLQCNAVYSSEFTNKRVGSLWLYILTQIYSNPPHQGGIKLTRDIRGLQFRQGRAKSVTGGMFERRSFPGYSLS